MNMIVLNVSKKITIKLTYKPPYLEAEEMIIGQIWEYQYPGEKEPSWFGFLPKYLQDFDYRMIEDGRETKEDLLQYIKGQGRTLERNGYLPPGSKIAFSMLPVEQVF